MHYHGHKLCWANRRRHTANVVFGEVLYNPSGVCGPRVQQDYELVILHNGECHVTVDGAARDLEVDDAYLFLPGHQEYFRFSTARQTHHSFCSIRPSFMPKGLSQRLRRAPVSVPYSEVFRHLLTAAFKLRSPQNSAATALVEQLGLCCFAEYVSKWDQFEDMHGQDPAVNAFLHYVAENFGKEHCLEEAHRAAGISRNGLIRKFHTQMNTTPERYLWRFRVERGRAMLRETGHTATQIAFDCGFKNQFHFSRLIKQCCGLSPKALRQQASPLKVGLADLSPTSGDARRLR